MSDSCGLLTLTCSRFQHKCTDDQSGFFVPTLAAFVGDIMEANTAFGIMHHAALHQDITSMVHRSRLNDPEHEAEVLTEAQMIAVCLGAACQYADLFRVLPVALLAFASARSTFLHLAQGLTCSRSSFNCCGSSVELLSRGFYNAELLEFQTLRDFEQHTESALQALDDQQKRQVYQLP